MALAEADLDQPPSGARRWGWTAAALAALLAVALGLGWLLKSWLGQARAPARQVARITILPDRPPPPPPPPPKELPRPDPQRSDRPPPPQAEPRPAQAPAAENVPLKMEGPAGDGPSPFQAGTVTQDYRGQAPGMGASTPRPAAVADRAAERLYAQTAIQTLQPVLQAELERRLHGDPGTVVTQVALWVDASGQISRAELLADGGGGSGSAELRQALDEARHQIRLAPPPGALAQPLRLRLTLRASG